MKNTLNLPAIGTFALFMFIFSSCSKTEIDIPYHGCDSCSAPPTKSVTLGSSGWQTMGGGVFSSDFGTALTKATGGYVGISNAYLINNGQEFELADGNGINAFGGQLKRSGTHLYFTAGSSAQLSALQSILVRVVVY